jgi:hypothetical protein
MSAASARHSATVTVKVSDKTTSRGEGWPAVL